jgi:hypothetical protein
MSSTRTFSSLFRMCCFRKLSVPQALMFMYRHMDTNCGRDRLSKEMSSLKSLATRTTSVCDGVSPVDRTWRVS